MALIACNDARFFDESSRIDWFLPNSNFGEPADFAIGAYSDSSATFSLTVLQVAPRQAVTVSACGGQPGERCNVEATTSLLLADDRGTGAPISLRFEGTGVRAVGAFMVAPRVAFGTAITPKLEIQGDTGPTKIVTGPQGVTGDIWQRGDAAAPFVGVRGSNGTRIKEVRFDVSHPGALDRALLGISALFCFA